MAAAPRDGDREDGRLIGVARDVDESISGVVVQVRQPGASRSLAQGWSIADKRASSVTAIFMRRRDRGSCGS